VFFRNEVKNPKAFMRFGLLSFLIGSVWHWFVHPNAYISDKWVDGIFGLFLGFAIISMLLSIAQRSNRGRSRDAR
jgi:hypothetical protein